MIYFIGKLEMEFIILKTEINMKVILKMESNYFC